jgi:Na+/H+-dicarboxylate symporter
MTELQAEQVLLDLASIQEQLVDVTEWLAQIQTNIVWVVQIMFPLVAFCLILWWVLKRYMY